MIVSAMRLSVRDTVQMFDEGHSVKPLTLHPSLADRHRDLISVRRALDAKMVNELA